MSCTGKPECPPCPQAVDGTGTAEAMGVSGEVDAGVEKGDGGVAAVAIGGKPKEVTSFELHGRAGFLRVSVFSKPDTGSPRLGYLYKGARSRLEETA